MKQWMMKKCNANLDMIMKRYKISDVLAEILVKRQLYTWDAMDKYLFPDIETMYAPELMKDLTKAADLLSTAVDNHKKIMIIGDYDVDGIMSSYILYRGIEMMGGNVECRIPHRVKDGYGIRDYMVDEAVEKGVEVIITCDNGISAEDAAKRARELGLTYILTDHHEVPCQGGVENIPTADAVVNPKQQSCKYPFDMLCGAGVAYKLMSYIFDQQEDNKVSYQTELLPFAAIATVCDVVPLIDENRVIVSNGINIMSDVNNIPNLGLRSLIEVLGINRPVNSGDFGFRIGPCLNAAGRLDDARRGLELLIEKDPDKAGKMAQELVELNEERKDMTAEATLAAVQQIEETDARGLPVLVIYIPDCHESVAGIVAGRIREKYYRPTYVLTKAEKGLKGSGRSIPGYHMQQELAKCQSVLTEFGGHAMAAGFSLPEDNLELFRSTLNRQCELTDDELVEKITFDMELPLKDVSKELISQLGWMEPFGESNAGALFARRGITVKSVYMCGKEKQIARLRVMDDGQMYDAVDFHAEEHIGAAITDRYGKEVWQQMKEGRCGQTIDMLYVADINDRYGNVQFKVVDCR